jgi:hypothetical protein
MAEEVKNAFLPVSPNIPKYLTINSTGQNKRRIDLFLESYLFLIFLGFIFILAQYLK